MPLGNLATKIREAKTSEVEPQVSKGISERGRSPDSRDDTALAVLGEPSEVEASEQQMIDTNQPPPPIAAAPAIQETDPQEAELDELLAQLKLHRRHTIEDARKKGVPTRKVSCCSAHDNTAMKALIHAASLWLCDDLDDWTAANDTIYSFTSPFGLKQLQYPNKEKVFITDIRKGRNAT